jgi:hypothetical protein
MRFHDPKDSMGRSLLIRSRICRDRHDRQDEPILAMLTVCAPDSALWRQSEPASVINAQDHFDRVVVISKA